MKKCILKYVLIVLDRAPPVVVPTSPAPAPPPVPPVAVPASPASTAAAPTPPPPAAPGANNQTPTKKDPTQVSLKHICQGVIVKIVLTRITFRLSSVEKSVIVF